MGLSALKIDDSESFPISGDLALGEVRSVETHSYSNAIEGVVSAASRVSGAEARRVSRLNASKTSDEELQRWLEERKQILKCSMTRELQSDEKRRLRYANWNIETIMDARSGGDLDKLEAFADRYEKFRNDLERTMSSLKQQSASRRW